MYQNLHTDSAVYTFTIYPIGTQFMRISGIYTFLIIPENAPNIPFTDTNQNTQHQSQFYTLLYIGRTNNFYARLKSHHKIKHALQLGMTHIGIHRKSISRARIKIENDLIKSLNPPLNQT